MTHKQPTTGETVFTWTAPHAIRECPVIHAFEWQGRRYVIVVTREEPGAPILAVREPDQCFDESEISKFFGD